MSATASQREIHQCTLLAYQLLIYFDPENDNPHHDLLTDDLSDDILRFTDLYTSPGLPKHNPYPADWALTKRELERSIRQFLQLRQKVIPVTPSQHRSPPQPEPDLAEASLPSPVVRLPLPHLTAASSSTQLVTPTWPPSSLPVTPFQSTPCPLPALSSSPNAEAPLSTFALDLSNVLLDPEISSPPSSAPNTNPSSSAPDTNMSANSNAQSDPVMIPRAELQDMINSAIAASQQTLQQTVQQSVNQTFTDRQDELRGPAGRDGIDAPQGKASWKSDDIGYFTPNPSATTHVQTTRGTTYYLNVYAFINQLKAMVPLKSEEVVRANLPSCLREAAARWYAAELSDEERQDLSVRTLNLGWFAALEKRFKPRPTEALTKVMSLTSIYGWKDVRAGRNVTEWAQNMLRRAGR